MLPTPYHFLLSFHCYFRNVHRAYFTLSHYHLIGNVVADPFIAEDAKMIRFEAGWNGSEPLVKTLQLDYLWWMCTYIHIQYIQWYNHHIFVLRSISSLPACFRKSKLIASGQQSYPLDWRGCASMRCMYNTKLSISMSLSAGSRYMAKNGNLPPRSSLH